MRKIKDVLRLFYEVKLSQRAIARSLGIGLGTVSTYLQRARTAGVSWPLPAELQERDLGRLLFPSQPASGQRRFIEPDYPTVVLELKRKGVTKLLLWQEYRQQHPDDGYSYAQFCHRYRLWLGRQQRSMRQVHRAGEKLFIDYCGPTVAVVNADTGDIRDAQIFVAVLGASNYTFACATWTQKQPDWLGAHVQALEFFGGVPELLVPDNLKSAVRKTHRYEPDITASYQQLAAHYQTAIVPARPYKPKDKAKAEVAVQIVERWILARLRNMTFFDLADLNTAIAELLVDLNARAFQKIPGSRRELFEQLDKPVLSPLPDVPYEYAEWKKARVHVDYHVETDKHFYSVPYQLVAQKLDVRMSAHVVEAFHKGKRVASHQRCYDPKRRYITLAAHMPKSHQEYAAWTPERLVRWAQKTGPAMAQVFESILINRPHPQQGFRSCLGMMRLGKKFGEDRLEAACRRAVVIGGCSYKSIESILKNGLDRQPLPESIKAIQPLEHPNIRGAQYYR